MMLRHILYRLRAQPINACFCTLAIHPQYRRRAQLLIADIPTMPWIVLTDEPEDFTQLPVRAIRHMPTGPMAVDFQTSLPPTGNGQGRPAYHDKRFVLEAALKDFDTAIFVDADSRMRALSKLPRFPPGIAVGKGVQTNITDHLRRYGSSRRGAFERLALHLFGDANLLDSARWCSEALFAITKDGNESKFLEAWGIGATFLHERDLFTGEGGVIGLAAAYAGWTVDYRSITRLAAVTTHEGGGPKLV